MAAPVPAQPAKPKSQLFGADVELVVAERTLAINAKLSPTVLKLYLCSINDANEGIVRHQLLQILHDIDSRGIVSCVYTGPALGRWYSRTSCLPYLPKHIRNALFRTGTVEFDIKSCVSTMLLNVARYVCEVSDGSTMQEALPLLCRAASEPDELRAEIAAGIRHGSDATAKKLLTMAVFGGVPYDVDPTVSHLLASLTKEVGFVCRSAFNDASISHKLKALMGVTQKTCSSFSGAKAAYDNAVGDCDRNVLDEVLDALVAGKKVAKKADKEVSALLQTTPFSINAIGDAQLHSMSLGQLVTPIYTFLEAEVRSLMMDYLRDRGWSLQAQLHDAVFALPPVGMSRTGMTETTATALEGYITDRSGWRVNITPTMVSDQDVRQPRARLLPLVIPPHFPGSVAWYVSAKAARHLLVRLPDGRVLVPDDRSPRLLVPLTSSHPTVFAEGDPPDTNPNHGITASQYGRWALQNSGLAEKNLNTHAFEQYLTDQSNDLFPTTGFRDTGTYTFTNFVSDGAVEVVSLHASGDSKVFDPADPAAPVHYISVKSACLFAQAMYSIEQWYCKELDDPPAPMFHSVLERQMSWDRMRVMLFGFAKMFWPSECLLYAMLSHGMSRSGKSSVWDVITSLIPLFEVRNKNFSPTQSKDFFDINDRIGFVGGHEMSMFLEVVPSDTVKQLITDNTVTGNRKHAADSVAQTLQPGHKIQVWGACNLLPASLHKDPGVAERLVLIEFTKKIPDDAQNLDAVDTMVNKEALYIVAWMWKEWRMWKQQQKAHMASGFPRGNAIAYIESIDPEFRQSQIDGAGQTVTSQVLRGLAMPVDESKAFIKFTPVEPTPFVWCGVEIQRLVAAIAKYFPALKGMTAAQVAMQAAQAGFRVEMVNICPSCRAPCPDKNHGTYNPKCINSSGARGKVKIVMGVTAWDMPLGKPIHTVFHVTKSNRGRRAKKRRLAGDDDMDDVASSEDSNEEKDDEGDYSIYNKGLPILYGAFEAEQFMTFLKKHISPHVRRLRTAIMDALHPHTAGEFEESIDPFFDSLPEIKNMTRHAAAKLLWWGQDHSEARAGDSYQPGMS